MTWLTALIQRVGVVNCVLAALTLLTGVVIIFVEPYVALREVAQRQDMAVEITVDRDVYYRSLIGGICISLQGIWLFFIRLYPRMARINILLWDLICLFVLSGIGTMGTFAVAFVHVEIARKTTVRRGLIFTGAYVGISLIVALPPVFIWGSDILIALLAIVLRGLTYLGMGTWVGIYLANLDRQRQMQTEREILTRQHLLESALIEERRRLARELHDVAAHHLAGMVVQTSVVKRLISKDPQGAIEAAEELRLQSKETLEGLRSVVTVLRDTSNPFVSMGVEDIDALVADIRRLGVDIDVHRNDLFSAPPSSISREVGTVIYRVIQQSVSNALQHAPGAKISIHLWIDQRAIHATIVNGPPIHPPVEMESGGSGLAVMRERARDVGGTLHTGPAPDGGWEVLLTCPLVPSTKSIEPTSQDAHIIPETAALLPESAMSPPEAPAPPLGLSAQPARKAPQ
ncbi:MAG: histidine kinase [Actinomycetaceae bacterium]|nr:histidine kinase [Actinomycetaceae bacterium]